MATCAVCGEDFPEGALLYGDRGPSCAGCLAAAEERAALRDADLRAIVGPPALVVAAFVSYCVPFVGPVIGIVVSLAALGAGLAAVQRWRALADEPAANAERRGWMLASGVAASAFGVFLVGVGILLGLGTLFVIMG